MADINPEVEQQGLVRNEPQHPATGIEPKGKESRQAEVTEGPDPMFIIMALGLEAVFLVLFAIGGEYYREPNPDPASFSLFQDIHTMLLIGFGFLVAFLSHYSFGGIAFNFLLCATCIQWQLIMFGVICQGWRGSPPGEHLGWGKTLRKFSFSMNSLVEADMGTVAILISMGALLGRVTPSQLLLMSLIEVPLYAINFYIVHHYLRMTDAGGSATIHVFGCYFGLAASLIIGKPANMTPSTSIYHSELLTMIGTLFLWLYFPSFNAYFAYIAPIQESGYDGLRRQSDRTRAFVNTIIALCASTIAAFVISKCNRKGKLNMTHIQNATLAGGVAMGACADLYTNPAGAVAIGFFAGMLSAIGFKMYETTCPSVGLYDTRGVNNLHGIPGILGCVASAITVGSYSDKHRYHRSMHKQGGYQIAGLCVSFGIAIVGGVVTGALMKILPSPKIAYNDSENFIVAETDYYYGTIRGKQKGAGGQTL